MSTLNFNIGVLGHVDSGKTSLSKALSTTASTACFDKNPQSKQRGITLDLGFSSFTVPAGEHLKGGEKSYEFVQYTLVDCPGHASLIKTIIGGAQIIDMMMLVIDIVKGVQTQTAECLIIGEICCDKLLIVLNKLDLIEETKRQGTIEKMSKRLLKTLENTKFANSPIIACAASKLQMETPSSSLVDSTAKLSLDSPQSMLNIDKLIETLSTITFIPKRNETGPFLFSVDHCFNIKGSGTIMTGTVLSGSTKINETVEIPVFKQQKKVKSIQVFRKPVEKVIQGDRCGICFTNFDAKQFERGILCDLNHAKTAYAAIISLQKIRHFKGTIQSGSKFHITIGHETILAKIDLFTSKDETDASETFDFKKEYLYLDEYQSPESQEAKSSKPRKVFALIDFSSESEVHSVLCVQNSLLIGSKLDTDIHLNQCRIAFHGHTLHLFANKDFKETSANAMKSAESVADTYQLSQLKVYKEKAKEGVVERKQDEQTIIGKALFKKETNMELFNGLKVTLSTGETGVIEGSFGQSGKFKVRINGGLLKSTLEQLDGGGKSKKGSKTKQAAVEQTDNSQQDVVATTTGGPVKIFLNFKKFVFSTDKKKIAQ